MLSVIKKYYTDKIKLFGPTAAGVDWNSGETQALRFKILSEIIDKNNSTILDYGCGYGAYYNFLKVEQIACKFTGFDFSEKMIEEAQKLYEEAEWVTKLDTDKRYDYVFASGIFNVMLENDKKEWEKYVFDTIRTFDKISINGFAFNMLTTYSDKNKAKPHLFYIEPEKVFSFCKENISNRVILDHSYPLFEFTVRVKK